MLGSIIIIIFAFLAGICNAIMDTIAHHWDRCIFLKIKSDHLRIWFRSDWRDKPDHPFWFLWDAWHCFKTLEHICWLAAIALAISWRDAIIFGAVWTMMFNIFYHKILLLKS